VLLSLLDVVSVKRPVLSLVDVMSVLPIGFLRWSWDSQIALIWVLGDADLEALLLRVNLVHECFLDSPKTASGKASPITPVTLESAKWPFGGLPISAKSIWALTPPRLILSLEMTPLMSEAIEIFFPFFL